MASPARTYLLCSMPRSGSTLLAELLDSTCRLGRPAEYLDPTDTLAKLWAEWRPRDLAAYVRRLHQERTDDHGTFGCKLHWYHLSDFARGLVAEGTVGGSWCERRRAALELLAPGARFVTVVRRDLDRQAVSWYIAERTLRWTAEDPRGRDVEVPYDGRAIECFRRKAAAGDRAWARLLDRLGADVLEVVYEELVQDRDATVRAVAGHVGVDLPPDPLPPPSLRRQADRRYEELLARFRAGEGRGPAGVPR